MEDRATGWIAELLAQVAASGPTVRSRLKGRSSAELLPLDQLAEALRTRVEHERAWREGRLDADKRLRCDCAGAVAPLPDARFTWFEEWGWAREADRLFVVAACAACGTVWWAGGRA